MKTMRTLDVLWQPSKKLKAAVWEARHTSHMFPVTCRRSVISETLTPAHSRAAANEAGTRRGAPPAICPVTAREVASRQTGDGWLKHGAFVRRLGRPRRDVCSQRRSWCRRGLRALGEAHWLGRTIRRVLRARGSIPLEDVCSFIHSERYAAWVISLCQSHVPPRLGRIMSGGTEGLGPGEQPVASDASLVQHFSAIQWQRSQGSWGSVKEQTGCLFTPFFGGLLFWIHIQAIRVHKFRI